jgi:hypothetical protein
VTLHDRPTAAELVEAVREYLQRDVMSSVEGRLAFHARVATNALSIVGREMELADDLDIGEQGRLETLLGCEGTVRDLTGELARRIRDGSLDDRRAEVIDVVRQSVRAKLAVANPRYLEP